RCVGARVGRRAHQTVREECSKGRRRRQSALRAGRSLQGGSRGRNRRNPVPLEDPRALGWDLAVVHHGAGLLARRTSLSLAALMYRSASSCSRNRSITSSFVALVTALTNPS